MSLDPGNVSWVGPCSSFYDHIILARGELGAIIERMRYIVWIGGRGFQEGWPFCYMEGTSPWHAIITRRPVGVDMRCIGTEYGLEFSVREVLVARRKWKPR